MKSSKIKKNKSSSQSHAAKTKEERDAYNQKVKNAPPESGTKEQIPDRTSTLSTRSIYGESKRAGIADRDPIKPPLSGDGLSKWMGIIVKIISVLTAVCLAIFWVANLKNKAESNEKRITQLDTNFTKIDSERENLNIRIVKLELWKDAINYDLQQIKADVKNGVSTEQIDIKLMALERRIFEKLEKSKMKEK